MGAEFRCPFETIGERQGSIIKATLSKNRSLRLREMRRAFDTFNRKPKSPGIKFIIPGDVLKGCDSLEELKVRLIPYQAELAAIQLEEAVGQPALYRDISENSFAKADHAKLTDLHIAFQIRMLMQKYGFPPPKKPSDIANWISHQLMGAMSQRADVPTIEVRDTNYKGVFGTLVSFGASGIIFPLERAGSFGSKNRSTFSFVKAPFYPKDFGRYSKHIEIVVTREADFTALSSETRRNIRRKSNTVLERHGIPICDLDEEKPENGGVWVPPKVA